MHRHVVYTFLYVLLYIQHSFPLYTCYPWIKRCSKSNRFIPCCNIRPAYTCALQLEWLPMLIYFCYRLLGKSWNHKTTSHIAVLNISYYNIIYMVSYVVLFACIVIIYITGRSQRQSFRCVSFLKY